MAKYDEVVDAVKAWKFTQKQIDDYVVMATKNPNAKKVMLGKYDNNGSTSYIQRAGKDHTYFDIGNKWDDVKAIVNGSDDEMWRINKQFIDKQKTLKKEFYLSHDPFNSTYKIGFYAKEIDYLTLPISQGGLGGSIVNQGSNLWKIVW